MENNMGGTVKKIFGGGSSSKPDTSAYEAQLEEQRKATEAAEAKAAAADARARDQQQRLQQGRAATIFTSGEGDTNIKTKKPTLGSGM
jgi:hypothetical protein|nr:MAG TPA: hypothetical protein [Caudoviricetes sp.]